jgi:hypothetical protein
MKGAHTSAHKVFKAAAKQKWNVWREHYDELTITDLIWINLGIDQFIREQVCRANHLVENAIELIVAKQDELSVVELGCYRGGLAQEMITRFGKQIKNWDGYDINYYAVENPICEHDRYTSIKMTEWFYDTEFYHKANVFVTTSTLEHHNRVQFAKIIKNVSFNSNIKYMILGLPLCDARKWNDYGGSHVLDLSKVELIEIVEDAGFAPVYYEADHIHLWLMERQ